MNPCSRPRSWLRAAAPAGLVAAWALAATLPASPASADVPPGAPSGTPSQPPQAAPRPKPSAADEAKAKQLFLAGNAAYKQTDYAGALTAFRAAYQLDPRPGILFSTAQTMRRLYILNGDVRVLREAEAAYRRYLAEVAEGGRRTDAIVALGEIEPTLRAASAQGAPAPPPPAATQTQTQVAIASQADVDIVVSVDGAAPLKSAIVQVTPGKHTLVISAEGYLDEKRVVDVPSGALQSIDVQLKEKPATLSIKGADGAEVIVDGRTLGAAGRGELELPHGTHLVALIQNGHHAYQEELEVSRGVHRKLEVSLAITGQRKVAYALFGIGGLGVIGGGAILGAAFAEQAQAQDLLTQKQQRNLTPAELDGYSSAVRTRDDLRVGAGAAFGVSTAILGAGLLLYAFDRPSLEGPQRRLPTPAPERPAGPSIEALMPVLGPGHAGLSVSGRF